jgi:hypothetical protein
VVAGVSTRFAAARGASDESEVGALKPFQVDVPEEALVDLRRRIAMTRWPDKETVGDDSQGVQLAAMQEVARYWGSDYDWRRCEAKLNALPQSMFARSTEMRCHSSSRTAGRAR